MEIDSPPRITARQQEQFRKEGYIFLERVIPEVHLQTLRRECRRLLKAEDAEMDRLGVDTIGLNHRNKRYFMSMNYVRSKGLRDFLFSDRMAAICRATLGGEAYLFLDQFVVKCAQVGMKFSWHQDSGYIPFKHHPYITCWCALEDVGEENGTVYLLPYSRAGSREVAEHVSEEGSNDKVGYHGDDPGIPVVLSAGGIAVFSSTTFHRSGPNTTDRMRPVLVAQYSPEPIYNPDGKPRHWVAPFLKGGRKVACE